MSVCERSIRRKETAIVSSSYLLKFACKFRIVCYIVSAKANQHICIKRGRHDWPICLLNVFFEYRPLTVLLSIRHQYCVSVSDTNAIFMSFPEGNLLFVSNVNLLKHFQLVLIFQRAHRLFCNNYVMQIIL